MQNYLKLFKPSRTMQKKLQNYSKVSKSMESVKSIEKYGQQIMEIYEKIQSDNRRVHTSK